MEQKSRIFLSLFIVAVIWGSVVTGLYFMQMGAGGEEETQWDKIVERGYILAATSPDYPPFEYLENDEIVGFDAELMQKIATNLSLSLQWDRLSFPTIIPSLKDKKADVGIAAFSITASRLSGNPLQTSIAYWTPQNVLILTESAASSINNSLESLKNIDDEGFTIGVQLGTVQHDRLLNLGLSGNLQTYDKADAIITELNSSSPQIDGAFFDSPVAKDILEDSNAPSWQGTPLFNVYEEPSFAMGIYMHEDFDVLCNKINQVLATLIQTGWIQDLAINYGLD